MTHMFLGNVYLTTVKNRINYPVFTFGGFVMDDQDLQT